MTVLHVSKFYPPAVGGIEQVVRTLAEGVPFDAEVVCAAESGRGTCETVNGVRVRRAGSPGTLFSVPAAPAFPVHFARRARAADLIHYHLPNPLAVVSALFAPVSAPTVATYHSDIVRQSSLLPAYQPMLQRFLDGLDRIVVTSPRLLSHSPTLDGHESNCTVVPLSVDTDAFGGEPPPVELPVDDLPTVLFVGRLVYYKGVEHLVDAMADVDARLLVVGEGNQRASLERRAVERGVADRVSFLGRVDDATLHACYAEADVFALPSVARSEAFGVVQLEAMAYRTPVVNTDLPTGVPWVSRDGETGVTVPPGDSGALAAALDALLSDDEWRRELGERARRRVEDEFGTERMLSRITEMYEDLGVRR